MLSQSGVWERGSWTSVFGKEMPGHRSLGMKCPDIGVWEREEDLKISKSILEVIR